MSLCVTVDVEDWYDSMAEGGHPVAVPAGSRASGLGGLRELVSSIPPSVPARITLFVIGKYCSEVGDDLSALARDGHEMASHGPDHNAPPENPRDLEDWLRRGREMVEDFIQRPVRGFRSPRFRVPQTMTLDRYRDILGAAGFEYVSDRYRLGAASAVRELPVFQWNGLPFGGGSYQRILPRVALKPILEEREGPTVVYYHSYDFGATLPSSASTTSPAVLKQVIGRARIPAVVDHLLRKAGSLSCTEVAGAV